jgi:lipoprotein-anchoring transpeptidase ErfK/SrfK
MGRKEASLGGVRALGLLGAVAAVVMGCKHDPAPSAAGTHGDLPIMAEAVLPDAALEISATAKLAAIAMQANVYAAPSSGAKKLGYLRLGTIVSRSEKAHGTDGCSEGWYAVAPRGFVCAGKLASLEIDAPIVRAARVRPDTSKPLPYAYAFVRAHAPLYLRPPTAAEAQKTEFKLDEHLDWWARRGKAQNRSFDGYLLGAETEAEPLPFWLEPGERKIPNVSSVWVPPRAVFANRLHRHTGVAVVGSFEAGEWGNHRRFALTVDMRLLPVDKLKPEVGSAFHGVALEDGLSLPVAFARPCDPGAKGTPKPCRSTYRDIRGALSRTSEILPTRGFLELTGAERRVASAAATRYFETKAGTWVSERDVAVATAPSEWPQAAQRGQKWIDVSIAEQTLVLFEGKKAVFATVVSTGQDGLGDPKTTKSTPLGTFRVNSKHITATMDSDGRGAQSGGAAPTAGESAVPTEDDKTLASRARGDEIGGAFELRDVPYVQYFHEGYALHSAYWHDHFGVARSHGCINLAPIDAQRVFGFTDPPVPEGWHGTNVDPGRGTTIVVRR